MRDKKIFIVDDEELFREMLGEIFLDQAASVSVFSSGAEAVNAANNVQPDLLVIDWLLCEERVGLEVARELVALHPRLKVIIISGLPTVHLENDLEEAVMRLLKKPFRERDVLALANELLLLNN